MEKIVDLLWYMTASLSFFVTLASIKFELRHLIILCASIFGICAYFIMN